MATRLIIDNTHRPIAVADYPVGVRLVPAPSPMFTGDELVWACFFSGLAGVTGDALALAFVWALVL
jgi:hypothetical protein